MTYYYSPQLYHHGILGQHWGKRNGPPYPLGASQHSASERKAGWRKSLDKNGSESDSEQKPKKKGLSDKQKKALKIGAAVVGAAAITAGTAYVVHKADAKLTKEMRDYYVNEGKAALMRKMRHEHKADHYSNYAKVDQKSAENWKKLRDKESSRERSTTGASKTLIKKYDEYYNAKKRDFERNTKMANVHRDAAASAQGDRDYYLSKSMQDKYSKQDKKEYKRDIKFRR